MTIPFLIFFFLELSLNSLSHYGEGEKYSKQWNYAEIQHYFLHSATSLQFLLIHTFAHIFVFAYFFGFVNARIVWQ